MQKTGGGTEFIPIFYPNNHRDKTLHLTGYVGHCENFVPGCGIGLETERAEFKFLKSPYGYKSYLGEIYQGMFTKGVLRYENGAFYRGGFKDGKFSGKGIFQWSFGQRFEGFFKNGEMHGFGIWCSDFKKYLAQK
jgi:hypothetical protein